MAAQRSATAHVRSPKSVCFTPAMCVCQTDSSRSGHITSSHRGCSRTSSTWRFPTPSTSEDLLRPDQECQRACSTALSCRRPPTPSTSASWSLNELTIQLLRADDDITLSTVRRFFEKLEAAGRDDHPVPHQVLSSTPTLYRGRSPTRSTFSSRASARTSWPSAANTGRATR